jgi:hypothetical protein
MLMTAMLSVGPSVNSLVEIHPDPQSLTWGLQDISSSDAGRTLAAGNPMYKMRTSQKRKLQITWVMLTDAQISTILKAFNPEYFYVRYWDAMDGQFITRRFYAGDRTAPVKWFQLKKKGTRFATLSFDIIEV